MRRGGTFFLDLLKGFLISESQCQCCTRLCAPVRSQFLMLEYARCSIFLMLAANLPLKIFRQILAKILHFQSNTQAKARSFSNARANSSSNSDVQACLTLLSTRIYSFQHVRFFHTRCNTTICFKVWWYMTITQLA